MLKIMMIENTTYKTEIIIIESHTHTNTFQWPVTYFINSQVTIGLRVRIKGFGKKRKQSLDIIMNLLSANLYI